MTRRLSLHISALSPLALIVATSCGSDRLTPDDVSGLPVGDGVGADFSGEYDVEALTTSCSGDCGATIDGRLISACDVGTRNGEDADVTQVDGALTVDVDGSNYISRLEGGVDVGGSFRVGGFRTVFAGDVTSSGLFDGTFTDDGIEGVLELSVVGSGTVGGDRWALDCGIVTEVSGSRRGF